MPMIPPRSQARRIALQALYQLDVQGDDFMDLHLVAFLAESHEETAMRELALTMIRGAWYFHSHADVWVGRLSAEWTVARMPVVDRSILRLAVWELVHGKDVPPKVVLDEAIDMAREFSTAESPAFINGILDAVYKEHLALTQAN